MSIMNRLSRLASSPQGRKMTEKAKNYAKSPEGKRKIAETRERIARRPRSR